MPPVRIIHPYRPVRFCTHSFGAVGRFSPPVTLAPSTYVPLSITETCNKPVLVQAGFSIPSTFIIRLEGSNRLNKQENVKKRQIFNEYCTQQSDRMDLFDQRK